MKYPKWNNYCSVKRKGKQAEVNNHLLEESFVLPLDMVRFGKKLNGKRDPFEINPSASEETVCDWLDTLEDVGCIRDSRITLMTTGTVFIGLYIPDKISLNMRMFAWFYNKAIQLLFLPMLFLGIYTYSMHPNYGDGGIYIGMALGTVVGVLLHEISHACAALACPKGNLFEIGVGITYFIIPIGYAIVDIKEVKNRLQRVQVNLAGVETNIFLGGMFFLLSGLCGSAVQDFFLGAAIQNLCLAFLNLAFCNGIDGASAIEELLGDNNFISKSKSLVRNSKKRREAFNSGISGYALVTSAYVIRLLQLTIPALYIWNIITICEAI